MSLEQIQSSDGTAINERRVRLAECLERSGWMATMGGSLEDAHVWDTFVGPKDLKDCFIVEDIIASAQDPERYIVEIDRFTKTVALDYEGEFTDDHAMTLVLLRAETEHAPKNWGEESTTSLEGYWRDQYANNIAELPENQ